MENKTSSALPRTFWWHNTTQAFGAMNDNIFKLLMVYALIAWHGSGASATILASVGLVFALPFLLIVPIAGSFADRFSKNKVIRVLKLVELGVMAFGIVALQLGSSAMLYVTMFLMASQSAFFSPCKYGIIPEQVVSSALSKANGALQLFTYLAIIAGTVLAPELSLLFGGQFGLAAGVCLVIAAVGYYTSTRISLSPAHPEKQINFNGPANLLRTFGYIRKDRYLLLAIGAAAFFSLSAAFIQLNVLNFGYETLDLTHESATRLFLLIAVGIGVGSTTAGLLSGRGIEFGVVPIGAGLMSLMLLVLGTLGHGNLLLASLCMPVLGFGAGLFVVPIEAFIQLRSPKDQIGSFQACNSFLSWVGILIASGLLYFNTAVLNFSAQQGFAMLAVSILVLALFSLLVLPDFLMKFVIKFFTRFCYRLRVRGLDNLPTDRPALLVCNHISLMDAVLLMSSQQRRVRMLMSRSFYENSGWFTRKVVDLAQVILIHTADNPKKLIQSLKSARTALDEGYVVCVFAEGALSRTGMLRPFKPGFERIVKGTDYPIIPVYIGGAWGSVASYRYGMPKIRPLRDFRYPVSVHFGAPLPATSKAFDVQQAVSELSVEAYQLLKPERKSLAYNFVRAARSNWSKLAIAESSGKEFTYGQLLTASHLLRQRIIKETGSSDAPLGILLPTGVGSMMTNLAVALDQRTSVNLNYTAPNEAIQSAESQCELNIIISSRKFLQRFPEMKLSTKVLYLEDLMANIGGIEKVIAAIQSRTFPAAILCKESKYSAESTATILFSSGSTAEPKGIMLSHHNLLSNIESLRAVLAPRREDVMLATLPLFHSFGYTATFWFPLLSGLTIASHNNPLEGESIGTLAAQYRGSILLTTPTFLMAYCRKIKPAQFAHLRYVFTGAEKLQTRVAQLFEKRFGITPLEGYGATELAPVCALSMPNVEIDDLPETGHRADRLGRPLPGIAVRIVHPDTGEALAPGVEGMILVKGPNVMQGYLKKPELTASVLKDGWYTTGDIGLMDADGFFAITGRQSRFSKIGGEMISHGAIEKALQDSCKVGAGSIVVIAIPDEKRGEKLCVLHTLEHSEVQFQKILQALNIPNLWKPSAKNMLKLASLPILGTGKLDFRTMQALAFEAFA
jgi:acyl-[acyl-carrier-protein]-phospholipid O-acyltransferase/long-chain-fatty-acid--[acyl-carrier-protein] ligase